MAVLSPRAGIPPPNSTVIARWTGPIHRLQSFNVGPASIGPKRGNAVDVETKRTGTKRWFVLLLISLMYLVTYLDRANISTVAPVIAKEFDIGKIEMGFIFSAFVWSYALFQ